MSAIKKIRKIGIVLRPVLDNDRSKIDELKHALILARGAFSDVGIEIIVEENSLKNLSDAKSFKSAKLSDLIHSVDAFASLGGDGTLISLIRKIHKSKLPVFGINLGKLGFLTSINPAQIGEFALDLKEQNYVIDSHMMLEASVKINNKNIKKYAINEFLISKDDVLGRISSIHSCINGQKFNTYIADSLIISTPTGSTAYNISAGGPIVYPLCDNIILTPVAAHTLTQRPMVVPNSELTFSVKSNGILIIDGQENIPLDPMTKIKIRPAKTRALLIQSKKRSFFKVLKEKFNWGQND
ncbi:MAG: NAD(+)/NADH kinase [Helicobacter sp.]|nr:NAD(+)/NADH kinase [Helicobacter sp.]